MKNFFKKLKSERGATGIDVVMAAAMIMITITVVSILYVNTSLQTRNINRTAGATRIITNIAENIQALSYEDFVKTVDGMQYGVYKGETEKYRMIESINSIQTIFGTKIPKGYTFYIKADEVYGSHTEAKEKFDLVRAVDIIVTYKLGNSTEEISVSLTKQRELIDECNKPEFTYLSGTADKTIYPVKYVETIGAYIKTTEDDVDWYDYSNKKWAVIFVTNKSEDEVFDANGKYKGVDVEQYAWIPAFFTTDGTSNQFGAFRYNNSDQLIDKRTLNSKAGEDGKTSSFSYYTFVENTFGYQKITEDMGTGMWINIKNQPEINSTTEQKIRDIPQADILNNSVYGPFTKH